MLEACCFEELITRSCKYLTVVNLKKVMNAGKGEGEACVDVAGWPVKEQYFDDERLHLEMDAIQMLSALTSCKFYASSCKTWSLLYTLQESTDTVPASLFIRIKCSLLCTFFMDHLTSLVSLHFHDWDVRICLQKQ